MSIAKPFTFISGTYAKSAEVNADFDTAYSQINSNTSNINKNASDIVNLDNTKANINGNASEVFNVANPTASSHAINKQTFFNLTSNMKYFIAGYTISVDSGSPDDTIIVSEGSCYDSAYQVMLTKNVSTTKQNSSQTASATYYVYVIGNSTGSSVDILISTSSSNPGLPAGYSLFRQIGYYTTNSDSNIDIVNYFGQSTNSPSANSVIVGTYQNGNSWYRVYSDGWCEQGGIFEIPGSANTFVKVNLLKPYANTNYNVVATDTGTIATIYAVKVGSYAKNETDGFYIALNSSTAAAWWQTSGYIR